MIKIFLIIVVCICLVTVRNQIVDIIEKLRFNSILCADVIIDNGSSYEESTIEYLESLTEITKVYFSLANHEFERYNKW